MENFSKLADSVLLLNRNKDYSGVLLAIRQAVQSFGKEELRKSPFIMQQLLTALVHGSSSSTIQNSILYFSIQDLSFGFSAMWTLLKKRFPDEHALHEQFLNCYNPALLNNELRPKSTVPDDFWPTDLEQWVYAQCQVLLQKGKANLLLELLEQWQPQLVAHRNGFSFWIQRKRAQAMDSLQRFEDARLVYEALLELKQDWYLYAEWACLLLKDQKQAEAKAAFAWCLLGQGELKFKIHALEKLATLVDADFASLHQQLCSAIRLREGWPEAPGFTNQGNSENQCIGALLGKLKPYWRQLIQGVVLPGAGLGEICKILHQNEMGKDGFLKPVGKSESYYFQLNPMSQLFQQIKPGYRVRYKLKGTGGKRIKAVLFQEP